MRTNTGRVIAGAVVLLCSFFAAQVFFVSAQTTSAVVSNEVVVYVKPKVECITSASIVLLNQPVIWTATVKPAGASYSYSWSSEGASPSSQGPDGKSTYVVQYGEIGKRTAKVSVVPEISVPTGIDISKTVICESDVTVVGQPDLTAAPPVITCEPWARLETDRNGVQKCHKKSKLSIVGSINNIGTAATQHGTFTNLYQYSTDERVWQDLAETELVNSAALGAQGSVSATNRPLKPYSGTATEPWVAGYSPASDYYWYFRVCTDNQKSVPESDEGNNCSASTRLKVLALKPDVKLWISRTGEPCQTLKQTQAVILKGNKALLCWLVTPIEVFE